ncbi:hypothetical protein V8G54_006140 [Vigna mungo]|uniref:Uncharacterized protein n=1 Tax=Vigna mungo TaxID=3915 RepID=A0AAQ3P2P9_VIGMU
MGWSQYVVLLLLSLTLLSVSMVRSQIDDVCPINNRTGMRAISIRGVAQVMRLSNKCGTRNKCLSRNVRKRCCSLNQGFIDKIDDCIDKTSGKPKFNLGHFRQMIRVVCRPDA